MIDKEFKIYIHNLHSLKVKTLAKADSSPNFLKKIWSLIFGLCYYTGLAVFGAAAAAAKTLFLICYHIGNLLWISAAAAAKKAFDDYKQTRRLAGQRLKILTKKSFFQTAVTFVFFAAAGSSVFLLLSAAASGLEIKDQIVSKTFLGKLYLQQAKDAAMGRNLETAQNKFRLAYGTFESGKKQLAGAVAGLSNLISLVPQAKDADRLLEASKLISQAGLSALDFYNLTSNFSFSLTGLESGIDNSEALQKTSGLLRDINKNLSAAYSDLSQIDPQNIPQASREDFIKLQSQIKIISTAFNNTEEIFSLIDGLFSGNKRLLLIFQNNNELRATGGFIGTYGLAKISDGKILDLRVSSVYDLDGQLDENIMPPRPMLNVNSRWYLRDSNWFPDFPTSARKIASFYEKEGGQTPDEIIALTPALIQSLLKITGPISMSEYGVVLDSDNFVEKTQVASSGNAGRPLNQPKQILADFVPKLFQALEAQKGSWPEVLEALQNSLLNKQAAIYSRYPEVQRQLENFQWTGGLQPSDRDYLAVISSNLGGTKTDLYQDQKLKLTVDIQENGEVTNNLEYSKTNKMPELDDSFNLSYLRFFVPQGSQLLSNLGFDFKALDPAQGLQNFKDDPDVFSEESHSVKDVISGTVIGQESGKTFFGNWLELKGGQTKTVSLSYRLPFLVKNPDHYSLLLQKQMGSLDFPVELSINFSGRSVAWKNFEPDSLENGTLKIATPLDKDYFWGIVLNKNP